MNKTKFRYLYIFLTLTVLVLNTFVIIFPISDARAEIFSQPAAQTYAGMSAPFDSAIREGDVNNVPEDGKTVLPVSGTASTKQTVYLGGTPLGLELLTRGLIIIGKTDVITEGGLVNPTKNSDIEIGDVLLSVNGKDVNSAEELSDVINSDEIKGREVPCQVMRKGREIDTVIGSALDVTTSTYKTGLWIRQETFGIGTLTFIRQDMRFASLGHPVIDGDTKDILSIRGGRALPCSIVGCVRGERGKPGELKGMIIKDRDCLGTIDKNNIFGVYGCLNGLPKSDKGFKQIETMPRSMVKPGKAHIYTTINGGQPQMYEIDIVKTAYQAKPADRSMVIRITDRTLLSKTGGIVQGMSGSPIVQNGKLCGAVTHVFVNDPTRGYGLYADWMLGE